MEKLSDELNNHISSIAKSMGAVLVGYTEIRRSEPVIIYGFNYSDMWFLKRPYTMTKRLNEVHKVSRKAQDSVSRELKNLGYSVHDKTVLSLYGDFRPLAVSAGLGQWGRNGLVVNKDYGSSILYAATFTDAPLSISEKQCVEESTCSDCNECVESCPAGAFKNNSFSTSRCMSKVIMGCAECLKICRGSNN